MTGIKMMWSADNQGRLHATWQQSDIYRVRLEYPAQPAGIQHTSSLGARFVKNILRLSGINRVLRRSAAAD